MITAADPHKREASRSCADLMREGKLVAAIEVYQDAEKISHLRNVHKVVVFIIGAVTRPDFLSGFDISCRNIDEVRVFADLFDRRVLQIGFYSVYLTWGEIDATDMPAMLFSIDVLVRVGFFPGTFRNRCDIMVAVGLIVIRNQTAAQLTDDLILLDFYCRIQP